MGSGVKTRNGIILSLKTSTCAHAKKKKGLLAEMEVFYLISSRFSAFDICFTKQLTPFVSFSCNVPVPFRHYTQIRNILHVRDGWAPIIVD